MEPFPHYWPFLMGIHRCPVDSHHKGPVMGSLGVYFVVLWRKKRQMSCQTVNDGVVWCLFCWHPKKKTAIQTVELPFIWDALTLMWSYNDLVAVLTTDGDQCALPFNYRGITYTSCSAIDSANGNTFWCSLDTDYVGRSGICDLSTCISPDCESSK